MEVTGQLRSPGIKLTIHLHLVPRPRMERQVQVFDKRNSFVTSLCLDRSCVTEKSRIYFSWLWPENRSKLCHEIRKRRQEALHSRSYIAELLGYSWNRIPAVEWHVVSRTDMLPAWLMKDLSRKRKEKKRRGRANALPFCENPNKLPRT
jgi:hypothetical protein